MFNKKQRIAALDHTTPGRRRVSRPAPDGCGVVTERIPWQPYLKAVSPSGAVGRIPVSTHRANRDEQDPYKHFIEHDKLRKGFIPYGKCPQTLPWEAQQWLPAEIRGRQACRTSVNGTPITGDSCCQCIEELITARKAAQRERMEKLEIALSKANATNDLASAVKDIAVVVADLKTKVETPSATAKRNTKD